MGQKINIVEYNPSWEKEYETEAKKVKALLGNNCVTTVHVGSSAIKGMKGRNIVDIMVLVKDIFEVDEYNEALSKQGYEFTESYGPLARYLYEKKTDGISFQLQVYENGDYDDIQKFVAFRDYVEKHNDIAKKYIQLKEDADEENYREKKGEFVKEVLKDAISWHELKHKKDMSMTISIFLAIIMLILCTLVSSNILIGLGIGAAFGLCVYFAFYTSMKKKEDKKENEEE